MGMVGESIQIVRLLPDGGYQWTELLGVPGSANSALLLDLDTSAAVGATEFEVTQTGEWLATVAGMRYNLLPGVIEGTGRFCFIGLRAPKPGEPPPIEPPIPPVIDLKDYSDDFNRANGEPGPSWELYTSGAAYLRLVNNELTASAANEEQLGYWIRALPAGVHHHKVEVTVGTAVPTITYLFLRGNDTGGHVRALFRDSGVVELLSCEGGLVGGVLTPRGDVTGVALAPGAKLSVEAAGPDYIARVGGVEVLRWTDDAGEWPHVDDTHLNVGVGLNLSSLKSRVLTSRAGVGMAIDDFAATVVDYVVPEAATAEFTAEGTLSAEVRRPNEMLPKFTAEGALSATVEAAAAPQLTPRFSSEGVLIARMEAVTPPTVVDVAARFSSEGTLIARMTPIDLPNLIRPKFAGEGTLSATVETFPLPISDFDFHEAGGATATSTISAHTLAALDPATAWQGEQAKGEFNGVVGAGVQDDWTVAMWVTVNSYGTHYNHVLECNNGAVVPGVSHGIGYGRDADLLEPSFWLNGVWHKSGLADLSIGVPRLLVATGTPSQTKLYLDHTLILTIPDGLARDFDGRAQLFITNFQGEDVKADACIDRIAYWDVTLTPEEVAALPLPPPDDRTYARFSGEGTLAATMYSQYRYADDFNRPDGAPGDKWEIFSNGSAAPNDVVVKANELAVVGDDSLANRIALWVEPLPGDDHKVEFRIGTELASSYSLIARASTGDGHMRASFSPDGANSSVAFMSYEGDILLGAGASEPGGGTTPPLVTGMVLGLKAVGSNYIAYVDDVEVGRWNGTTADLTWDHVDENHRRVGVMIQSLPAVYQGTDKGSVDDFRAASAEMKPFGDFDFHEGSGSTATSSDGEYVLTATDPATAWDGEAASGEFVGVVGGGTPDDWSAEFTVTVNAYPTSGATPSFDDSGFGADTTLRKYLMIGYAGLLGIQADGGRPWSAAVVTLGEPHTVIWGQRSAGLGKTGGTIEVYLDGALVLTCPTSTGRAFSEDARLLAGLDGTIDQITYRNTAPPIPPPPEVAAAFSGEGTLSATMTPPVDAEEITATLSSEGSLTAEIREYGLYEDNFNRPDGPPGDDWTVAHGGGNSDLTISNNALACIADAGYQQWATWNRPLPTSDYRVEATVGSIGSAEIDLFARQSTDNTGHIEAQFWFNGVTYIKSVEGAIETGTRTQRAIYDPDDPLVPTAAGMVLAVECVGKTYTAYRDDVAICSWTDAANEWDHVDDTHLNAGMMIIGGNTGANSWRASPMELDQNPVAHFDFHEGSGTTATSSIGDGVLTAQGDAATAWEGEQAKGHFRGPAVPGLVCSEWTVALHMVLNSVGPNGPTILENTFSADGTASHSSIGFDEVDGQAYPGFWTPQAIWEYSATALTVGVPHTLALVGDMNEAGTVTLYVDGVVAVSVSGQTQAVRYLDKVEILGTAFPQDAIVDNLTYWERALTPEEVAALPLPGDPGHTETPEAHPAFNSEGTLAAEVYGFALYHDDFNRPDGPPGDQWELLHNGTLDLTIVDNELAVTEAGNVEQAGWWKRALPGVDHKVEVRVGKTLPTCVILTVRSNQTTGHVQARFYPDGHLNLRTVETTTFIQGVERETAAAGTFVFATGTLLSLEATGPYYTARVDGQVVAFWYDIANEWPHVDADHMNVAVYVKGEIGSSVDYFGATDMIYAGQPPEYWIDNFNRPDGPPGDDWTLSHSTGTADLVITNGALVVGEINTYEYGYWNRPLPGVDHKVEVVLNDPPPYNIGLAVRASLAAGCVRAGFLETGEVSITSVTGAMEANDGLLSHGNSNGHPFVGGTKLSFEAIGPYYTARVNGAVAAVWHDDANEWPYVDAAHVNTGLWLSSGLPEGGVDPYRAVDLTGATAPDIPPPLYTDDFNRPDGPPGDDWTLFGGSIPLEIVGNQLVATLLGTYQWGHWNSPLPTPDHKVEVTVGTVVPNLIELNVRSSLDNGRTFVEFWSVTGQCIIHTRNGDYSLMVGSSVRAESAAGAFAMTPGTKLSFEAIGRYYIASVDGVEVLRWHDGDGVWTGQHNSNRNVAVTINSQEFIAGMDNFAATDLSGQPVPGPVDQTLTTGRHHK